MVRVEAGGLRPSKVHSARLGRELIIPSIQNPKKAGDLVAGKAVIVKPNETIRFACGECQVVFDLRVAPGSEWAEGIPEGGEPVKAVSLICCPFCGVGAHELKMLHYPRVRA